MEKTNKKLEYLVSYYSPSEEYKEAFRCELNCLLAICIQEIKDSILKGIDGVKEEV